MKRRAFTLIELLVVIGIIALLTAILIPALRHTRLQAKAVLCRSNVNQLTLGLIKYEIDNESFPYAFNESLSEQPPGGYPGNLMYDRAGWWWFNYIIDYSDKNFESVVFCPSKQITDIRLKYNVLCGNYGVNQSVCKSSQDVENQTEFTGKPLSSCDVSHPGRTFLVADCGYSMINWFHATDIPPESLSNRIEDTAYIPGLCINKEKSLWQGQKDDAICGRHPNKTVNVSFADGHVSIVEAGIFFVEKMDQSYMNLIPLWVPK